MATKAANRAPRKPGRPPADGTDQRERLLDAALTRFSEAGIAATSLRSLAHATGVTPAMLNYYFGSKKRLVEAIVEERLLPIILRQKQALLAGPAGGDLAVRFISGLHATVASHPWLPALWVREVLSEGGQLREVFVERIGPQLAVPLVSRFKAAQDDGEINASLDPRLLFVSLIGLVMVPFAAEPIWGKVFGAHGIGPDELLTHTLALVTSGIEA
ncbi:MAG: TetR/AcrR family transcriptional regulator [Gammaproteobacteria bacterium]|nr:TetR/AcrR family transcriptional regulator [Gammaproteobacteria bacterium]